MLEPMTLYTWRSEELDAGPQVFETSSTSMTVKVEAHACHRSQSSPIQREPRRIGS